MASQYALKASTVIFGRLL